MGDPAQSLATGAHYMHSCYARRFVEYWRHVQRRPQQAAQEAAAAPQGAYVPPAASMANTQHTMATACAPGDVNCCTWQECCSRDFHASCHAALAATVSYVCAELQGEVRVTGQRGMVLKRWCSWS